MKTLVGVLTLVLLTGCTIERTVVQETTTTTVASPPTTQYTPPTTSPSLVIDESGFLNAIEAEHGDITGSEKLMLDTGYLVCGHLDAGGSLSTLEDLIYQSATDLDSVEFLSFVTASAVVFLCPWHVDAFNSY